MTVASFPGPPTASHTWGSHRVTLVGCIKTTAMTTTMITTVTTTMIIIMTSTVTTTVATSMTYNDYY